jgi:hypothetical protein
MNMISTKTETRGGARSGAGRKKSENKTMPATSIRFDDEAQREKFKRLGGTKWLKSMLDAEAS